MKKTSLHIAILMIASGLFFFFKLGSVPLLEPDEGRNAEVAREMLATGDWCTPHLNYERKLNKPVLLFWASALSMKLAGATEGAARLPSAAAAAAGVLAVYFLGRRMFGERAGLLSGLVLASSPVYIAFSRIVIFDMLLAAFITLALLFFYLGFTEIDLWKKRLFYLLFYASISVAVLAKGLIGAVIPAGVIGLYLLATRSLTRIREMRIIPGVIIAAVIASPWYVMMSIRNPEFPRYFFITEHFVRYATDAFSRVKPIWYYVPVVIAGIFPWVLFLPSTVKASLKKLRENGAPKSPLIFLFIWAGLVFLFFSFSRSKLAGYILPLFPALALMFGRFWDERLQRKSAHVFGGLFAGALLFFTAGLWALNIYGPERSSKMFADRVLDERRPGDLVVAYESFPTSLLFYLGQQVPIISDSSSFIPGNFRDNRQPVRPGSASTIGHREFRELLADRGKRIYVVGQRNHCAEIAAAFPDSGMRLLLEGRKSCLWVRRESGSITSPPLLRKASPSADTGLLPAGSRQQ